MKLRGLILNFYIHVSMSDSYVPQMKAEIRNEAAQFRFWYFWFEFSMQCKSPGNCCKNISNVFVKRDN
jgi:hypothetical protein